MRTPRSSLWSRSCWLLLCVLSCTKAGEVPLLSETTTETAPIPATPSVLDLWAGVPPLEAKATDVRTTLTPEPGPAKPTIGEHIELPLAPPEEGPPPVDVPRGTPLKVERFGPEGTVALVDAVRVSFDQPMVPLAAVDELRAKPIPVEIDPRPPGQVRWLGTRTLVFEPEGRMPFSTTYKVKVPKGVTSDLGGALPDDVAWEFTTPVLALQSHSPWDGQTEVTLEPTITLAFNQRIDRTALVAATKLRVGGKEIAMREVPPPALPEGAAEEAKWAAERSIVLAPVDKLEPDTSYRLRIDGGAYGEGPNKSGDIEFGFSTYPPLKLSRMPCWDPKCYASEGINLQSTTSLVDATVEGRVHVDPAVDGMAVSGWGNQISISGKFEGLRKYTVTVDPGVEDVHKQKLDKPFVLSVKLGPPYPMLTPAAYRPNPAVVERDGTKVLDLRVAGLKTVEVSARAFAAEDVDDFIDAWTEENYGWPTAKAKPSHTETFNVKGLLVREEMLTLDLGKMVEPGKPFLWLIARSNEYMDGTYKTRAGLTQLIQVTDLGVAAAIDCDSGLVLVTKLSSGEPVADAELRLTERDGTKRELWKGKTDANGLATVAFTGNPGLLYAKTSDDQSFLRLDQSDLRGQWMGWWYGQQQDQARAFMFTDRTPYKPGETIHLTGVIRNETRGPDGKVEQWRTDVTGQYFVNDPRGIEVAKGDLRIGKFGTFTIDIPTDENGGTGYYNFRLEVGGFLSSPTTFYHSIPVETYRTPEFTVKVERGAADALTFGETLEADVIGEYLHGAPLVGADVVYTLTRSDTGFVPPGEMNEGFSFGIDSGWGWHGWGGEYARGGYGGYGGMPYGGPGWYGGGSASLDTKSGTLDARGRFPISWKLQQVEPAPPGTPVPPTLTGSGAPAVPAKVEEVVPRAVTYSVAATVTDKNRQAIAGSGTFVVHPAEVYVGLRADRTVLKEGERAEFEAVLVDLQGERVAGNTVTMELSRKETTRKAVEKSGVWTFEYETKDVAAGSCSPASALTPVPCAIEVATAGTYTLRATAQDAGGRTTRSELQVYVHGKDAVVWEQTEHRIDLVPDRKKYRPGDTATVLVRSPFDAGHGVLVVQREGIKDTYPFTVVGGMTTVEIPIVSGLVPSVELTALVVRGRVEIPGAPSGQDLGMPAAAAGSVQLEVVVDEKRIDIAVEPDRKEIAPGETIKLTLRTTSADGSPAKAALTVMVVDEGVLSLMGYTTPDPLAFFHHARAGEAWVYALQAAVLPKSTSTPTGTPTTTPSGTIGVGGLGMIGSGAGGGGTGEGYGMGRGMNGGAYAADDESEAVAAPAPMAEARSPEKPKRAQGSKKDKHSEDGRFEAKIDPSQAMAQPVQLRSLFSTTAFFDAEILTDNSGLATVEIPMPENLTTFRVMAVAVDPDAPDRFGKGESTVKVRKPIMVRPSMPRFLNFGDVFEGSVMVDNQTGAPQQILVGTRGLNVAFSSETQKFVDVPAGESREVRFDMSVEQVGNMRLQFAAMSNGGRDATELSVPVHYPATAEAFADYGMTTDSILRHVEAPADALPAFGGIEIGMSSTAMSGLEDAVDYLVTYPYECAEQTASRILPIFALRDVLQEFPIASVADRLERDMIANEGIDRLIKKQGWDGGFGYWDARESWPYLTNWVTLALLEGKRQGYTVDKTALDRALDYVENYVTHGHLTRWGIYHDWTARAFGLWLLSGEGRGKGLFDTIWAHRDEMPFYARAQLMQVAHRFGKTAERDQVWEEIKKAVVESPRTVHFAESRSEADSDGLRLLMHSSTQTDAIVLMALLESMPSEPMLPKVMAGIMDDRKATKQGRWGTTHSNAWALLAASRYFETVEKDVPDFTARIWLDEKFSGEHTFAGRSMAQVDKQIPMDQVLGAKSRELVLGKSGTGQLYYRLGLRYARKDLQVKAEDQGFFVRRNYEALPEPGQTKPDPEAVKRLDDGSWQVKAGTNVRVSLELVVRDRANWIVVDDAMPAGFEGQNPRFLTSVGADSSATRSYGSHDWWWPWWSFDHTEMRDDRMLLFADQLWAGVYTYSYTARATSIGTFQLPPVKAEAMYEPERFGHSSSSVVRVVE